MYCLVDRPPGKWLDRTSNGRRNQRNKVGTWRTSRHSRYS